MIIEFYKVKILMLNFLHINVAGNVSFVVKKNHNAEIFFKSTSTIAQKIKKKALEIYSCKHKYK